MSKPTIDVVIDIETLGTGVDAKIIGIGAVAVIDGELPYYDTGRLRNVSRPELFHRNISSACQINSARSYTQDTRTFWGKQGSELKAFYGIESFAPQPETALASALDALSYWCTQLEDLHKAKVRPWGNGATFDVSMLEHAFRQAGCTIPWQFFNIRDVRTRKEDGLHIAALADIEVDIPFEGIKHYALDDAYHEAKIIVKAQQLINDAAEALKDLKEKPND